MGTNILLLRTAQLFLASEKKERGGRLISLEPTRRPGAAFFRGRDSGTHDPAKSAQEAPSLYISPSTKPSCSRSAATHARPRDHATAQCCVMTLLNFLPAARSIPALHGGKRAPSWLLRLSELQQDEGTVEGKKQEEEQAAGGIRGEKQTES